jgi:hypothetical protein
MPNVMPASPAHTWPVWPLPLLAGLLPLAATVVAYTLSVRLGLIEPCNPFLDGCVSISRAARHGLPNALFRAMVLPAAVLQALCWILYAASLRTRGAHPTWRLAALPWIGLLAAIFLMLYGSFLGTEGAPYRWMRRFGVTVYFGGTCLAMLIAAGAARGLAARQRWEARLMLPLAVSLPMLGLVNAFAPMLDGSAEMEAALQNVSEWWAGLVLTAFFFALAALWRKTRFELR